MISPTRVLIGLLLIRGISSAAAPDHYLFTAVLSDHVKAGLVDYRSISQDQRLSTYLHQLATVGLGPEATEAERLALWINAYNAYTLSLVAGAYPIGSIHELGTGGRIIGWLLKRSPWDIRFAKVAGREYTLNEIEHEILRVEFDEPRIHFAIVCAAISCPPLRAEAFYPARLDNQLTEQGRAFLADFRHNRFDPVEQRAQVSAIFSWFAEDFGGSDEAIIRWLAQFAPSDGASSMAERPQDWTLGHLRYDWSLNDQP